MAFTNNTGIEDFFHLQIDLVPGECGWVEVNHRKVEFKLQPSTKVCFLVNSFESDDVEDAALKIKIRMHTNCRILWSIPFPGRLMRYHARSTRTREQKKKRRLAAMVWWQTWTSVNCKWHFVIHDPCSSLFTPGPPPSFAPPIPPCKNKWNSHAGVFYNHPWDWDLIHRFYSPLFFQYYIFHFRPSSCQDVTTDHGE